MTTPRAVPLPVAIDAMGGDHAPEAIVAGAVAAAREGIAVLLVGDEARVAPLVPRDVSLEVLHAPEVLPMDASPTSVRRRPRTSLWQTVQAVADGRASAAVSCGNSGALLVAATLALRPQPGVERPGIATLLPRSDGGRLVLLDAGANVDCKPEQLAHFARLGAAYAVALGVERPRVGLLANGHEDGKGNAQVRAALPLVRALPIEVVGNIEPPAAMAGGCDVLVCDGFVGNVLLKSVEAAADTVLAILKEEIARKLTARMGAAMLARSLGDVSARMAWSAYGGGMLLGVQGVVIIGHGRANAEAARAAIRLAWDRVERDVVGGVGRELDVLARRHEA